MKLKLIIKSKLITVIRFLSAFTLCALLLAANSGCMKKDCSPKPVAAEADAMVAYANSIGMTPVAHSSGIYYEILEAGTGTTPTASDYIAITYVGKLLNGDIFDQMSTPNNTAGNQHWPLSGLIEGWKIGIPLIKEGGKIRLLIPSALAYGCDGRGSIPGNAPLFFEVSLVDVR